MDELTRQEKYKKYEKMRDNPKIELWLNQVTDYVSEKVLSKIKQVLYPKFDGEIISFLSYLKFDIRCWYWVKSFLVHGDLFLELIKDTDHPELGLMTPGVFCPGHVHGTENGFLMTFRENDFNGFVFNFNSDDVIHIKNGDGEYGTSIFENPDKFEVYVMPMWRGVGLMMTRHIKAKYAISNHNPNS